VRAAGARGFAACAGREARGELAELGFAHPISEPSRTRKSAGARLLPTNAPASITLDLERNRMDAPIIKPTASSQAAQEAAVAAADAMCDALRVWYHLEGDDVRPRLEVVVAHAEQGRALCDMLLADIERPRETATGVDAYPAYTTLQLDRLRWMRVLQGARALLAELPPASVE
jgi:hypothetical protein